jgi:hypothetical protein
MQLYKQYVRPHLEFAVQAWSPWQQTDKDILAKVQRRAVGMVSGLRSQDYESWLRELRLTMLEERRHQADMLLMFKLSRGDGQPNHGRLEIRRNSFAVRAGEPWNAVPRSIKRAKTPTAFKRQYTEHRNGMIFN